VLDPCQVAWWWSVGGASRPQQGRALIEKSSPSLSKERLGKKKAAGGEVLKAVRALRDALLRPPKERALDGHATSLGYTGSECPLCDKRHVGGLFCFLTQEERGLLAHFRFGLRTKGIREIDAAVSARNGRFSDEK
jgi:hypothetical protein